MILSISDGRTFSSECLSEVIKYSCEKSRDTYLRKFLLSVIFRRQCFVLFSYFVYFVPYESFVIKQISIQRNLDLFQQLQPT